MQILINNIQEKYNKLIENKNFLNNQNYVLDYSKYESSIYIKEKDIENICDYNNNVHLSIYYSFFSIITSIFIIIIIMAFILKDGHMFILIPILFILIPFVWFFAVYKQKYKYLFNKSYYNIFMYKKDKFLIIRKKNTYNILPTYLVFK